MSQIIRVEVTAEDIEAGKPRSGCDCPIALAVKRALGPILGHSPSIDVGAIWIDSEDDRVGGFMLTGPARRFVEALDDGDPVQPFAFDLDLIEEVAA